MNNINIVQAGKTFIIIKLLFRFQKDIDEWKNANN